MTELSSPDISEGEVYLSMNVTTEVERLILLRQANKISADTLRECMASITNCVYPYVPTEVRDLLDKTNLYLSQMANEEVPAAVREADKPEESWGRWG